MLLRFFLFLFFYLSIQLASTLAQPIFDLNQKLGKGVNMGNMFEAPNETAWGNPFQDNYFNKIANLGFNHVRIPIRWDTPERTMQSAPYTIDVNFVKRVQHVVDKALEEDLYVIINMHHHDAIFSNPDDVKPRFISQWEQIAEHFKDYDERLLFEVLNEPHDNLTPEKWNRFFAEALTTIRATNPTRAVLMGTANWGGLGGIANLDIPDDNNLILTIHYYEPFQFTHQGAEWVSGNADAWLGTTWEDTNLERQEVELQFQYLEIFAKEHNIPVHIGEFGAYSRADLESRVKWTNFLARWFEEQGYSWAYWEFSAGFGIYNPSSNEYLQPLADALLKTPMAEPQIVKTEIIFESDFTANDNEWFLGVQAQAGGNYTKQEGTAEITVTQSSNSEWHVQFVKNGISLKQGSRYLVTFEAAAADNASFTNYIGKTFGDYGAYSGYKNFTVTKDFLKYAYTFTMQSPDDPLARVAFDFASTQTTFFIKNFRIEEVFPETVTSAFELEDLNLFIYPNPTQDFLQLKGLEEYQRYYLVNALGEKILAGKLNGTTEKVLSLRGLNSPVLYLVLEGEKKRVSRKIILLK